MILKALVENTAVSSEYQSRHGICFYIETGEHKILFDLGPDDLFLKNAFDKHYIKVLGIYFNTGMDASLKNHPQVILTNEITSIDDQLLLFADVQEKRLLQF